MPTSSHPSTSSVALSTPRLAISIYFFILGLTFSTWAARLPAVQDLFHLTNGELGTVLLAMPMGSMVVLPIAGWLTSQLGSRMVLVWASLLYACLLPCLALMPHVWMLAFGLLLFGSAGDAINIAVNDQAVALEINYGQSIMSSFHALFSLGGMFGAGLGGIAQDQQLSLFWHFSSISMCVFVLVVASKRHLLQTHTEYNPSKPLFVRPDKTLMGLGMIALCVMLGEGAMADWSSIYLTGLLPTTSSGWTTMGYTAFSLAMAAGRFRGDWFTNRNGIRTTLIISGILSGLGLLLALLIPQPVVVIIGFACVGLGFATVVPLVYSAAGQSATMKPGVAIAAVSTVGYFGFLFGPPVIGWFSDAIGLRWALMLVVILSFMISILARRQMSK